MECRSDCVRRVNESIGLKSDIASLPGDTEDSLIRRNYRPWGAVS